MIGEESVQTNHYWPN